MLDAIFIYHVLFSELRPQLGGYSEIATDFWRREMIAILELGAYLSANKIVQQIWIVAYNDDKGSYIGLVLFQDQITVDDDEGCLTWSVIYNAFLSELWHRLGGRAISSQFWYFNQELVVSTKVPPLYYAFNQVSLSRVLSISLVSWIPGIFPKLTLSSRLFLSDKNLRRIPFSSLLATLSQRGFNFQHFHRLLNY